MRRLSILFIISLGLSRFLFAQTDCEQTLNTASAEFEAGRFYGLPTILKECLEKFSTEQKVRAYLLLTQAYLIMDDPTSAENSYLQLLKANPEFIANPTRDPIDVYYLSKKFTATPIFTPHFRIGLNTSLARNIYNLNTSSTADQLSNSRTYRVGYQLGAGLDWNMSDRWSLSLGLGYANKNLKTTVRDNYQEWSGTFIEKQNWIDIPLCLKYSVDSGRIRPFFYAGLAANLLISAKLTPNTTDFNSPNKGTQQVSQAPDQDITSMRKFFNRSAVFGGGVKYKFGKNFVYVDVRYMAGLTNLTKNEGYNPLLARFQYQSDFFRLDNLSISFGYVKPLYDPRKKKKAVAGLLEKLGIKRGRK